MFSFIRDMNANTNDRIDAEFQFHRHCVIQVWNGPFARVASASVSDQNVYYLTPSERIYVPINCLLAAGMLA